MPSFRGDLHIEVDASEVESLLSRVDYAIHPIALTDFMTGWAPGHLHRMAAERFAMQGDHVRGAWWPLAPATEEIRERYGFPPSEPINVRTGRLRDWLISDQGVVSPSADGVTMVYPGSAPSAAEEQKLATAQKGRGGNGIIPTGRTPPRPVLSVSQYDLMGFMVGLSEHLYRYIGGGGALPIEFVDEF